MGDPLTDTGSGRRTVLGSAVGRSGRNKTAVFSGDVARVVASGNSTGSGNAAMAVSVTHIVIAALAYVSEASGIVAAAVALADLRGRRSREREKGAGRGRYVPRHVKR